MEIKETEWLRPSNDSCCNDDNQHGKPASSIARAREVVRIGIAPRIEQNLGIDRSGFGMCRRMVQRIGQVAEKFNEDVAVRLCGEHSLNRKPVVAGRKLTDRADLT